MTTSSTLGSKLAGVGWQLSGMKYGSTAGLTMFFYDTILTFPNEVKYLWRGKFTIVKFCFLINRYVALCVLSFALLSSVLPSYDQSTCNRFILVVPLLGGIVLTYSINTVMFLRIYALYGRNKTLGFALAVYLLAELGVGLWSILTPRVHPYILPGPPALSQLPVLHSCQWEHSVHLWALSLADGTQMELTRLVVHGVCFRRRSRLWIAGLQSIPRR